MAYYGANPYVHELFRSMAATAGILAVGGSVCYVAVHAAKRHDEKVHLQQLLQRDEVLATAPPDVLSLLTHKQITDCHWHARHNFSKLVDDDSPHSFMSAFRSCILRAPGDATIEAARNSTK